jgi:hypothetical protein
MWKYKMILPIVLYVYEIWFPTHRKEYSFKLFEKRLVMEIYAPKMEGVTLK